MEHNNFLSNVELVYRFKRETANQPFARENYEENVLSKTLRQHKLNMHIDGNCVMSHVSK